MVTHKKVLSSLKTSQFQESFYENYIGILATISIRECDKITYCSLQKKIIKGFKYPNNYS